MRRPTSRANPNPESAPFKSCAALGGRDVGINVVDEGPEIPDDAKSPERIVEAQDTREHLSATLESYGDVVDRLRNREAARLLRHGGLSVTEISYVCGFSDGAHFARSFKKRTGRTPSAYRAES